MDISTMLRMIGGYQTPSAADLIKYKGFNKPSTCFQSVKYNPQSHIATYTFNNLGSMPRTYHKAVPEMQARRWSNAPSLGTFYNAFIKNKLNTGASGAINSRIWSLFR